MASKLIQSGSLELNIDSSKLEKETRKTIGHKYIGWWVTVESAKVRYHTALAACVAVFLGGALVSHLLLILLLPLAPVALSTLFHYGDVLDDKDMWERKVVTRIDP
ncbi:hypothetical protein KKH30_00770 [Candidatus Micrarchaeota archaeon]|nr:hypothetical protein [Candidatus Micrarchaeota archaeon]MBU1939276.1 hypothetical protein [Candidatus Micrarchaeota archaeon]